MHAQHQNSAELVCAPDVKVSSPACVLECTPSLYPQQVNVAHVSVTELFTAGCAQHEDGFAVAETIDGNADGAWRLPLPPLSATSLPEPYAPGDAPAQDRTRAARALVSNHAAVSKFAARAVGPQVRHSVGAPLSDPYAESGGDCLPHVDAALRHVAHALLDGVEAKQSGDAPLQVWLAIPQLRAGHCARGESWSCINKLLVNHVLPEGIDLSTLWGSGTLD